MLLKDLETVTMATDFQQCAYRHAHGILSHWLNNIMPCAGKCVNDNMPCTQRYVPIHVQLNNPENVIYAAYLHGKPLSHNK